MLLKPIVIKTTAKNGNIWWIAYHPSCTSFEVQINDKTKNIMMGMGLMLITNKVTSIDDFLEDKEVHRNISLNFNEETLQDILGHCKGLKCNTN